MIVFINGGSGSGKSAFAESVAQGFGGKMVYVATMPIFGEEDLKKVERHHKLRAGKGFETLERPKLLTDLPDGEETVLIECMSTHTANCLYDPEIDWNLISGMEEDPDKEKEPTVLAERIFRELDPILQRKGNTIFVSAEVGADGEIYDPETEKYKHVLLRVNNYLMEHADAAYEVVCGIPLKIKGELSC